MVCSWVGILAIVEGPILIVLRIKTEQIRIDLVLVVLVLVRWLLLWRLVVALMRARLL